MPGAGPVGHDARSSCSTSARTPPSRARGRTAAVRPAKVKWSPGRSRAMKFSSTEPSVRPRRNCTFIGGFAHDRADGQPVPHRDHATGDPIQRPSSTTTLLYSGYAWSALPPRVMKSSTQRHSSAPQVAEGVRRCAPPSSSSSGRKPPPSATVTACCASRSSGRSTGPASLDRAGLQRRSRAAATSTSSRALVGHAGEAADRARLVAAPAGALDQAAHALGAADLEHAVHRREVHAEVEGRGADDAAQLPVAQSVLDPFAGLAVERAVVQRHDPGPVGTRREQRLIPDLGRGAGVGEDERALALLDGARRPRAAAEGRSARTRGSAPSSRGSAHRPRAPSAPGRGRSVRAGAATRIEAEQRVAGDVEIAERRGKPERAKARPKAAEPRQRELGLHAALRGHAARATRRPRPARDGRRGSARRRG